MACLSKTHSSPNPLLFRRDISSHFFPHLQTKNVWHSASTDTHTTQHCHCHRDSHTQRRASEKSRFGYAVAHYWRSRGALWHRNMGTQTRLEIGNDLDSDDLRLWTKPATNAVRALPTLLRLAKEERSELCEGTRLHTPQSRATYTGSMTVLALPATNAMHDCLCFCLCLYFLWVCVWFSISKLCLCVCFNCIDCCIGAILSHFLSFLCMFGCDFCIYFVCDFYTFVYIYIACFLWLGCNRVGLTSVLCSGDTDVSKIRISFHCILNTGRANIKKVNPWGEQYFTQT